METNVHKKMTKEMVKLIAQPELKEFFEQKLNGNMVIDIIANGSYIEDTTNGTHCNSAGDDIMPWCEHFWEQNLREYGLTHDLNFCNKKGAHQRAAYRRAVDYWNAFSQKKWKDMSSSEKEKSLLFLGRIVHLCQDMGTPAHANDDMHAPVLGEADSLEIYVNKKSKYGLPAKYGIKDSYPIYYNPYGDIRHYFYELAKETIKYDSDDVSGVGEGLPYRHNDRPYWYADDLSDLSCDIIARNIMPKTHSFTAGLLVKFCKDLDVFNIAKIDKTTERYSIKVVLKSIKVTDDQDSAYWDEGDGVFRIINGAEYIYKYLGDESLDGGEWETLPDIEILRDNLKKGETATISLEVQDKESWINPINELIGQVELVIDPTRYSLNREIEQSFRNPDIELKYGVTVNKYNIGTRKKYKLTTYLHKIYVSYDTDPYGAGEIYATYFNNGDKYRVELGSISSGSTKLEDKIIARRDMLIYDNENISLDIEIMDEDDFTEDDSLGRVNFDIPASEWKHWIRDGKAEHITGYYLSNSPSHCKVKFKFVLEEYDDVYHGDIGSRIADYDWSNGWDNVKLFEIAGQTYLYLMKSGTHISDYFYNNTAGLVHIHKMNSNGSVGEIVETHDWSKGWDSVEFFDIRGEVYLYLMKSGNGLVHIHKMNSNGSVGRRVAHYDWTSGWDTARFYKVHEKTYLFLMKSGTGLVHIHPMNSNGSIGSTIETHDWSRHWNTVEFFEINGQTYIYIMKSSNGKVHIQKIDRDGGIGSYVDTRNWTSGWTNAKFYKVEGKLYLYTIKSGTGLVYIYPMQNNGKVGNHLKRYNWKSGWNIAEFFTISRQQYLYIMDSNDGRVDIHKIWKREQPKIFPITDMIKKLPNYQVVRKRLQQNIYNKRDIAKDKRYYVHDRDTNLIHRANCPYINHSHRLENIYATFQDINKIKVQNIRDLHPDSVFSSLKRRLDNLPKEIIDKYLIKTKGMGTQDIYQLKDIMEEIITDRLSENKMIEIPIFQPVPPLIFNPLAKSFGKENLSSWVNIPINNKFPSGKMYKNRDLKEIVNKYELKNISSVVGNNDRELFPVLKQIRRQILIGKIKKASLVEKIKKHEQNYKKRDKRDVYNFRKMIHQAKFCSVCNRE